MFHYSNAKIRLYDINKKILSKKIALIEVLIALDNKILLIKENKY